MPITVNGPNGLRINFPDGTDPDTIDRVMTEASRTMPSPGAQEFADKQEMAGKVGSGFLFQDNFTGGLRKRVAGAVNALPGMFTAEDDMARLYGEGKEGYEELVRRAEERSSAPMLAKLAGGVATGGLAGVRAAGLLSKATPAAATAAGRIGQAIKEGAVLSGMQGLGQSEDTFEDVLKSTGRAAVTGAALSGAFGGALEAARPLARSLVKRVDPVSTQRRAGAERVLKEAEKAGLTQDDLVRGVREGRMVGQQDELLSDLTRSVKRQPGDQRRTIQTALNDTYEANNRGIYDAVSMPGNFDKWLAGFKKSRSANAKPAYQAAFRQNWGTKGPPTALDDLLPRVPGEALRQARKLAQAEGRPLFQNLVASIDEADNVRFFRLPSLEEAELIRRGLKSVTERAFRSGDGTLGSAYKALERDMRTILDDASPLLRKTRRTYADSMAIQEAAETGLRMPNMRADEIEALVDGMSMVERQAAKRGFLAAMKHAIERGQTNRDAVKVIFGQMRQQRAFRSLFKDQREFQQMARDMERLAEFTRFRGNVQGNSRTQQDLADAGALNAGGLLSAAGRAVTGDFRGAAMDALSQFIGRAVNPAKGLPPEQLKRMAEILVERDPNRVLDLLTRANQGNMTARANLQALIKSMMAAPARALPAGVAAGTVGATTMTP